MMQLFIIKAILHAYKLTAFWRNVSIFIGVLKVFVSVPSILGVNYTDIQNTAIVYFLMFSPPDTANIE